ANFFNAPKVSYLSLENLEKLVFEEQEVSLTHAQKQRVSVAHDFLAEFAKDKVIYGINTGFGPMAQYRIDDGLLEQLQYNLVRSHANGAGRNLAPTQVRAIMICRLNTLALGYSGTQLEVVETLAHFINHK